MSERIAQLADTIGGVALVGVFVTVAANVIMRCVFHASLMWSIEVSVFLFIISVFFSTLGATIRRDYMQVDAIIDALPHKASALLGVLGDLVVLSFAVCVTIGCIQMIPLTWHTRMSGVVQWLRAAYYYLVMLLSFLGISAFALSNFITRINLLVAVFANGNEPRTGV